MGTPTRPASRVALIVTAANASPQPAGGYGHRSKRPPRQHCPSTAAVPARVNRSQAARRRRRAERPLNPAPHKLGQRSHRLSPTHWPRPETVRTGAFACIGHRDQRRSQRHQWGLRETNRPDRDPARRRFTKPSAGTVPAGSFETKQVVLGTTPRRCCSQHFSDQGVCETPGERVQN